MAAVEGLPDGARAAVITVSDRSHGGLRHDSSGPLLASLLGELGFAVADVVVVPDEVDGDAVDRNGVAQRDEVGGALGRHDPGDAGDREDIALGNAVATQEGDRLGGQVDASGRCRRAHRDVLAGDVDHASRAAVVDVAEAHRPRRSSTRTSTG
jgi:hypothetical protein